MIPHRTLAAWLLLTAAACAQAPEPPVFQSGKIPNATEYLKKCFAREEHANFGPGVFYIDPAVTRYASGGGIYGADCPAAMSLQWGWGVHPLGGGGTWLVGTSDDPDEPMIQVTGHGFKIRDIGFYGAGRGKKQALGVVLDRQNRKGQGATRLKIEDVIFENFRVALSLGFPPDVDGKNPKQSRRWNSDVSYFESLNFHNCEQGIRFCHGMAMDHVFMQPTFTNVPQPAVIDSGGDVTFIRPSVMTKGTFLTFTDRWPGKDRPGPNNGEFFIEQLKVDSQAKGKFVLVEAKANSHAHIRVNGIHVGGPLSYSQGVIGTKMRLTIENERAAKPIPYKIVHLPTR